MTMPKLLACGSGWSNISQTAKPKKREGGNEREGGREHTVFKRAELFKEKCKIKL